MIVGLWRYHKDPSQDLWLDGENALLCDDTKNSVAGVFAEENFEFN